MSQKRDRQVNGLGLCQQKKEGVRQRIQRLPAHCVRALDADGRHRGKTWREVPGDGMVLRCCNWYLWKAGLINFREARAEADAQRDLLAVFEEEGGLEA